MRINIRVMSVVLPTLVAHLLLCSPAVAQQHNTCPPSKHTLYSRHAVSLDDASDHPVRVVSPDGKKVLLARTIQDDRDPDGMHISYTVGVAGRTFTTRLLGFNGEVAWSPDSKAFAVNQTEGGGGLGTRVYVFFVEEDGLRKLDVSSPIEKDFGHPVQCEIEVPPNTGFISWRSDSSALLVAAEVVPVSICKCMGTYRVYETSLPSLTIKQTYAQPEAQERFKGLLGCELRDRDDSCSAILERNIRRRAGLAPPK